MILTQKPIHRRTFLRGMGAGVALPLLDAMVPTLSGAATAAAPVRRLGYVYIPMGMNPEPWTPSVNGRLSELTPSLEALQPYLEHLTVVTNLEVKNAEVTGGNHATAGSAFLSCARAKRTEGSDYQLGTTVDQIVAQRVGQETPIPSLELGTDLIAQVGNCDNGFACVYMNSLAWASPTAPLPMEADPRVVFERLFGDGGTPEQRRREMQRNASILDWVLGDMTGLRRRIGSSDRARVEEYLDAVREVERRIQRAEQAADASPDVALTRPTSVPEEWEDHVKLMIDLQVLALQTDMTRVITFQMAREGSTRTYPNIGVPEPHHPVSHHVNDPVKLDKLAKINAYHVSLFGYLLERLRTTPDGDGTLLDSTTYVLGSGMGNPDVHNHSNVPLVIARGGMGGVKGGWHVRYDNLTPLANLHLTVMDHMGVELDGFMDSTGRAEEVVEPLSL